MRGAVELPNVHDVVFILQNGGFVVVYIQIVRSAENGHDTGKPCSASLAIHAVACILSFMGTNDGEQVVLL